MAKILVVDDELNIIELIRFNLEKEGHTVLSARDGFSGLKLSEEERPDLIVLDIMLPEMDGIEVCRKIRSSKDISNTPIIMLSARSETLDKVLGLEIGADDYVTKPFSPRELVARIKASLRRSVESDESIDKNHPKEISLAHVTINLEKFQVYVNNDNVYFTPKEFKLLKLLMSNPSIVFSRDQLLDRVWGYDFASDTRTVDVHIRYLRQKIEIDSSKPQYIVTVRGIGYKFDS
ncbi:MAG: response regulator transcription factor [Firmicutes bacterium]|nr:response regulator transcription factor [Bacillota bacterium]